MIVKHTWILFPTAWTWIYIDFFNLWRFKNTISSHQSWKNVIFLELLYFYWLLDILPKNNQ